MEDPILVAMALADPLRWRILDHLAAGRGGECSSPEHPEAPVTVCACDLGKALGGIAPSRLAYHLALLRRAGLVDETRRGKWVYYAIRTSCLEAFTEALRQRWTRASGCCFEGDRDLQDR